MCQLFALSCNVPAAVTFAFTGFSSRGGLTGEHADGFGVAFHDGEVCRSFIDEGRASDAPLAEFLRQHPYRARTVLAHIRKATQGAVKLSNCHPFVREWQGRHWVFAHNGDLVDFQPSLDGQVLPVGGTDSERAFCWMLQTLRRRFGAVRTHHWRELAPVIAELAGRIAHHGRFNFLLSDGEALYAHCSTHLHWLRRVHPFPTARLVDRNLTMDLAVANGQGDRMVLVATEPLTCNERWEAFHPNELRVFVGGAMVWQGGTETTRCDEPDWAGSALNPA